MKLKILQPQSRGRLKITLQKTGKFGFSSFASKLLCLDDQKFIKFGRDEDGDWYLKVQKENDGDCFKISKAGEYYYVNMSDVIVTMGFKKGDSIIFNLIPVEDGFYRMTKN